MSTGALAPTTKVWMTYAWADNGSGDVDFAAQQLIEAGLDIRLDRWDIGTGQRLWEQIERFIQDNRESDAWLMYVTQNSLGSEPCKEEYAYALDRALRTRGAAFPIIGLFPGRVDTSLIPAGIRTRLYVSLTDPDWRERIVAAAQGRSPAVARPVVAPYEVRLVERPNGGARNYAIEMRPRAGAWSPFFVGVPTGEKDALNPGILHGPRGNPPPGGMLTLPNSGPSQDNLWWINSAQNEATPTQSYFLLCDAVPSKIVFGVADQQPQYEHSFR